MKQVNTTLYTIGGDMSDLPLTGKAQDFIDGLNILRPYAGGTTRIFPKGLTVHIVNVNWVDLSESQKDVLKKKGWVKHYRGGYPTWISEG